MGFTYLRASDNLLYGAAVSTTAGATASTYTDDWLCDGRNRPVRATTGTATWLATASTSALATVAVVHSHTIDAARTVTIGGDVSGSLAALSARQNGIPVDLWIPIDSGSPDVPVNDISVGVSGNSVALVIAELLAGLARSFTYDFRMDSVEVGYLDIGTVRRQNESGSVPNFSRGLVARYLRADLVLPTNSERDTLMDWWESTREDTRPSAIKPFPERNEAWVVSFGSRPAVRSHRAKGIWIASVEFHEWPRKRWLS